MRHHSYTLDNESKGYTIILVPNRKGTVQWWKYLGNKQAACSGGSLSRSAAAIYIQRLRREFKRDKDSRDFYEGA